MKKLLFCIVVALTTAPLCALVWEEDPSITLEERRQRRNLNKRIRERGLIGSARLKGTGGEKPSEEYDRAEPRKVLNETDGGVEQMEEDTHDPDANFDDED